MLFPVVPSQRLLPSALLLLAFLLALAPSAQAQDQGDGSIYSRFGLGELRSFSSSQVDAIGGEGFAVRSLNYTNFGNPAAWSDQRLTRVAAGAYYQTTDIRNSSGANSRLVGASLNTVQFSLPLLKEKLGVGLSLRPYSRTNYRISSSGDLEVEPDSAIGFETNRQGQGGLQQVTGGFGYRFNEALSVGASIDVIFGTLEHVRRTAFTDRNFAGATRTDGTRLTGVTGTVGALLSLGDVLTQEDVLSVGATFRLPTVLDGEYTRTLGESLNRDTLATSDGTVDLPWKGSLGLAYQPDDRWTIAAGGTYEPWSRFRSEFSGVEGGEGGLPFFGDDLLVDRMRGSLGVELLPAGEDITEPYLHRTAYRLGTYFERGYMRVPEDPDAASRRSEMDINTLALTGGLSLPTMLSGTRLDINLEVGTRGTTQENLVRDVFYSVSLNVNIGEEWFQRRKLR